MHCPFCNHSETQVMETRELDGGASIRRRRRCGGCDRRFTTYERVELSMPDVVKSDGRRVPYQRDKLAFSMKLALRKRPVSDEALNTALDQVESRIFKLGAREIGSATIGEHVMDVLRELDTVAYIRFASVYRKFEDIEAFADVIQEIRPTTADPSSAHATGIEDGAITQIPVDAPASNAGSGADQAKGGAPRPATKGKG
ncbi:MAG: transcriptional regulator NrdR [Lautropia sp.]|nr:transcriptional regulator NrdR [Lautropia sp.]